MVLDSYKTTMSQRFECLGMLGKVYRKTYKIHQYHRNVRCTAQMSLLECSQGGIISESLGSSPSSFTNCVTLLYL